MLSGERFAGATALTLSCPVEELFAEAALRAAALPAVLVAPLVLPTARVPKARPGGALPRALRAGARWDLPPTATWDSVGGGGCAAGSRGVGTHGDEALAGDAAPGLALRLPAASRSSSPVSRAATRGDPDTGVCVGLGLEPEAAFARPLRDPARKPVPSCVEWADPELSRSSSPRSSPATSPEEPAAEFVWARDVFSGEAAVGSSHGMYSPSSSRK
mmetsp:Transcript_19675/g.49834  ORF Transcript_19675/g.49834 Transcript_19675/m.49834 type:complete len:217 (-) Transcript_19675:114-764(-)